MADSSTDAHAGDSRRRMTNQTRLIWAITRAGLPPGVKLYLYTLAAYAGNEGWTVWPSQEQVAESLQLSQRMVQYTKAKASKLGLIRTVWRGPGKPAIEFLIENIEALGSVSAPSGAQPIAPQTKPWGETHCAPEKALGRNLHCAPEQPLGAQSHCALGRNPIAPWGAIPFHPEQTKEQTKEQTTQIQSMNASSSGRDAGEHSCSVDQEPPNRSEPDDEDDRLAQIAREIIGPAVGIGTNNIPAVRIGEIVRASGGYAVNGRDRAEWGGDEPLDRARMLRAGLDVGLARMNGCRGMQALHTVRRVAIAAMHDAIPAGEYPAVFAENHKGPKFEKIEGW